FLRTLRQMIVFVLLISLDDCVVDQRADDLSALSSRMSEIAAHQSRSRFIPFRNRAVAAHSRERVEEGASGLGGYAALIIGKARNGRARDDLTARPALAAIHRSNQHY